MFNPINRKKTTIIKLILVAINIALITMAIIFSWQYSVNFRESTFRSELDSFCANVESMKQVSENYMRTELGYARDWAKYISGNDMNIDEAINYIRFANNQPDRYAHIVDMNTYEAYSTYGQGEITKISCYSKYNTGDSSFNELFMTTLNNMYSGNDDFSILGKYRADDSKLNVVSVGTRVSIRTDSGSSSDYLLLRVIPVESVRKIWVFPVEYKSAEIGIITKYGDYVVPSKSMKSLSFGEFIRAYNYSDDYNGINELYDKLRSSDSGVMQYYNSKGTDCYWYYSALGSGTGLDIIGCIPVSMLGTGHSNQLIVFVICTVFLILIILDGSYILHINKRLRYTATLANDANIAKTRFLSTMSHDIRTPMNGIIGMTNIAKAHINDKKYVNECLDKITLASDHLLTLINDILDISKIESGNIILNNSDFLIDDCIDKLINIVHVEMTAKNIEFKYERHIGVPCIVADELRLSQIFMNILTNAVKYTPKNGHISLYISDEPAEDNRVSLTYRVSDDGIGMSEEFQQNMYTMFAREKDSRIDKTQGTGLGLAIVRQIVDMMGGTISCHSEQSHGTTFIIELEFDAGPAGAENGLSNNDEDALTSSSLENMHVLIAEDNDLNWEILSEILKDYNVICDRAVNGRECIDILEKSPDYDYDLVLMDIQMPVLDGRSAARIIRQNDRDYIKNITIIATTADAFAEDIRDCLEAGMDGHISKPIRTAQLLDVLKKNHNTQRRHTYD